MDKLNSINGIYYDMIDKRLSSRTEIGVIAQEVEIEYPELVVTDENGFKSVDYTKFTPILIEAVKELKKENEELRLKNIELENRLEILESR